MKLYLLKATNVTAAPCCLILFNSYLFCFFGLLLAIFG